jgi:hypothetical protein
MKNININFSSFNFKKGRKNFGFGSGPETDWKFILVTFMILSVFIVAGGVYFFIKINSGDIFIVDPTETNPSTSTLSVSQLRSTLTHYKNKALEFERVKVTPEIILDPSR